MSFGADWVCSSCGWGNLDVRKRCRRCGKDNPENPSNPVGEAVVVVRLSRSQHACGCEGSPFEFYPVAVVDALLAAVSASSAPGAEIDLDRVAKSLATMLIEYVDGGINSNQNWRNGFSEITVARLRRLMPAAGTPSPTGHVAIAHDGFAGDIIGHYVTREGKRGVVVQQDGTRVVHVYGEKWLQPGATQES
jgi:hypothetical protein